MAGKANTKTIAQNKKAFHDYFVEESFEAGIELVGTEVKSLRARPGEPEGRLVLRGQRGDDAQRVPHQPLRFRQHLQSGTPCGCGGC